MSRFVALWYVCAVLFLAGFLAAGITAGGAVAVAVGSLSLLAFLAVSAARIGSAEPPTGRRGSHRAGPVGGGG